MTYGHGPVKTRRVQRLKTPLGRRTRSVRSTRRDEADSENAVKAATWSEETHVQAQREGQLRSPGPQGVVAGSARLRAPHRGSIGAGVRSGAGPAVARGRGGAQPTPMCAMPTKSKWKKMNEKILVEVQTHYRTELFVCCPTKCQI